MKYLKAICMASMSLVLVFSAFSQKDKSERKSPPAQVQENIGGTDVTIDYSRPAKRGREIFGELVKYGKVWRTGANETSWIEFSADVEIDGQKLAAGKYGLFTIPEEDEWTIIFNKVWSGWGAYDYKESDDVLRVKVKTEAVEEVEKFTISVDEGIVSLSWDRTKASFMIK